MKNNYFSSLRNTLLCLLVLSHTPPLQGVSDPDEPSLAAINSLREMQKKILEDSYTLKEKNQTDYSSAIGASDEDRKIAQSEPKKGKDILINFNNVSIIEYIRFVSRVTNKNFIFADEDLQFNVTIVSEEPTSIENTLTALIQELWIHDLILTEEGNNLIIHKNPKVANISRVVTGETTEEILGNTELITKVFKLNTIDPEKAALILRPLLSSNSVLDVLKDTNQLIITDLASNVVKISELLKSLDSPASGLIIGQYTSILFPIDTLIELTNRIMRPITQELSFLLVPQASTNRIYIVSTPYLVDQALIVLQRLDQQEEEVGPLSTSKEKTPTGSWMFGPDGRWIFLPDPPYSGAEEPEGEWVQDEDGNWHFIKGKKGIGPQPKGKWVRDANGNWHFVLDESETINPQKLARKFRGAKYIPGGEQKIFKFYIHKLLYRSGDQVEKALRTISSALQKDEKNNADLISALGSLQWIESTNSLVVTGTPLALEKIQILIEDIDTPLREVFIEMLILDTTVNDSLEYGVTYGTRFGGGNVAGAQAFIAGNTPINNALNTAGVSGLGQSVVNTAVGIIPAVPLVPDASGLAKVDGFSLGVIGRKLTHNGQEFGTIGALIHAVHDRNNTDIISNPKIIVEDGAQAEIFVGLNTAFGTQAIANSGGSVITNSFEFRDVGTRLKVTPYLGNDNMVTLDIAQEISSVLSGINTGGSGSGTNVNTQSIGPTTSKNNIVVRVHVPDGYFLVLGGLMQDQAERDRSQVPCLGAVPVLGAFLSRKSNNDIKHNTMIFMRPIIVDSIEEIQHLTKHQQDVWKQRRRLRNSFNYEIEEALDWFNVKKTLYSDRECDYEINE